ncbi:uncharacterized protein TRAVEDRAFT_52761 [Trametes versicolor FP-101664 SS1]|uniref:uncharacterized protein n=1 Tax=Trametes versicolor (strain FP-101664) TaxID=717944 RepID=UPI0004621A73|nr:uncharacterized protein TRAVEDRAFT_52761 [Trametes versicolor FP-101664 SS1]EIW53641.1 hypothetical protein TRAVEDRAFT_52761 [Trametes versicolor FP-101664 SS1]
MFAHQALLFVCRRALDDTRNGEFCSRYSRPRPRLLHTAEAPLSEDDSLWTTDDSYMADVTVVLGYMADVTVVLGRTHASSRTARTCQTGLRLARQAVEVDVGLGLGLEQTCGKVRAKRVPVRGAAGATIDESMDQ